MISAGLLVGLRAPLDAPIEKLWSKVKAWLRRVTARTFDAIDRALVQVLRTASLAECANYFRSCGYVTE